MNTSVNAAIRTLRRVSRANENGGMPPGEHLVLLSGALAGARAFMKHGEKEAYARVWKLCRLFSAGAEAGTQRIAAFFGPRGLTLSEAGALCALLPAAYAVQAAQALQTPRGGGEEAYEKAVKALFRLRETDFEALMPHVCEAEQALRADEAYRLSTAETRAVYRAAVIRKAKRTGAAEAGVIAQAKANGHVGFSLPLQKKRRYGAAFLAAEALCALLFDLLAVCIVLRYTEGFLRTPAAGACFALLLFLPLLGALRPLFNRIAAMWRRPFFLPSLDPESPEVKLPKTLVAVSTLLPAAENAAAFASRLEALFRANKNANAAVLALTDLKNAPTPQTPADEADIAAMKREIAALNEKYGGGFALAVRERVYSQTEREYTGYERKRGAIEALVRAVTDGVQPFGALEGDPAALENVTYILALDADTELPFEELQKVVCVAAHPMNRAVLNESGTAVVSGYGCFAPRTEVSSASAARTLFSRIMAWGGVSAYAPRVSNRCMDVFGTSVFAGKGLIDAAVYRAVCASAFPAGRVLSHDILEGGLLRTAFVSTAVFTEGFPPSPAAYYRRQHRWVRGDVQNLRFLFRALPGPGKRRLPGLTKYQLLDNAARAFLPPACCCALLVSVFLPAPAAYVTFAAALLGAAAGPLFAALAVLKNDGVFGFSRVYFSACLSAGARAVMHTLLSVAFLPYAAAVHTDAIIRAFFRSLIGRRTMEWTTAAEAEHGPRAVVYAAVLPFFAALALAFGRPGHLVAAALIVFFTPFALSNGFPSKEGGARLTGNERRELLQYTAAMWRFFAENAGPEENWLPPDHVQEMPAARTAHRTSPTNIGLYLCCALAAADLSLISPKELSERLSHSLQTVCSLRRSRGLLYNWYDTRTLEPLSPAFLSSVDCGNYLVSLTALKEGLKEYAGLGLGFPELIRTVENELENARIESLYVPRRKLFSVGLRLPDGVMSDSYYDYYMSEARLTSFYAAAKRLVPASHWGMPCRAFLRRGRRTLAASFSGTAFEYLMPALFLPLYQNTYAREGLVGCVWAQRRRVRGTPMPWGVSESAYFAFDGALGYCYRAHGLKTLAVKRDPDDEPVFAPYACFLALPVARAQALKNLRRFASLGAYGRYGFYEAVDFSARAYPEDYMVVRSFMAHHVGMSMLAAVNALRGSLFVKRFSRDADMAGALSLLREKIPAEAPVRRPPRAPGQAKRPLRPAPAAVSPENAALYSTGEVSLLCDSAGRNRYLFGRRSMLAYSPRAHGIQTCVKTGGRLLLPARGRTELRAACFCARAEAPGCVAETALALLRRAPALAVPLKFTNRSGAPLRAELLWYFEPLLEPLFYESEHPAFSDMRVRISYEQGACALLFSHVEHGASPVFLAVGFADSAPFSFCCDRELSLGYALREHPFAALPEAFPNTTAFTFPAAAIKTEAAVPRGGKTEKVLLLCPGADRAAALASLARLRGARLPDIGSAAGSPVPAAAAAYCGRFLCVNLFGARDPELLGAAQANTAPVSALWQQGISGDIPVLRVFTEGLPLPPVQALIGLYRAFLFAGVPCDLVLLSAHAGGYADPAAEALRTLVKQAGLSARLNKNGGVHILTAETCTKEFLSALSACPGLSVPFAEPLEPPAPAGSLLPSAPLFGGENGFVPNGYLIASRPPRPWSHVLANPVFGTLLSWGSLGFTWALDSRLNPLTPWHNDPCTPFPGETLLLRAGDQTYNALFGASVYFYTDGALFGALCGNASLRVWVQVDAKAAKKRVRVSFSGCENAALTYRVVPQLTQSEKHRAFIHASAENGALTFTNPVNADYPGCMRLFASVPGAAALDGNAGLLTVPLRGGGEVEFTLLWAAKPEALEKLAALPFAPQPPLPVKEAPGDLPGKALLLHTALAARIYARTGFYQNSGAYGFRDQLQDAANLVDRNPALLRLQILRCAAAQFPEGDVLHWFRTLPAPRPRLRGVRTLCADDALWLPYAVCVYLERTGDIALLSKELPFVSGAPLAPGERERHAEYARGKTRRSLYAHCMAAIGNAMRFGGHGLPLLRGGDWNDSFSELGLSGAAESVWLGMFLSVVTRRFACAAERLNDKESAGALRAVSGEMNEKLLKHAFNGKFFVRGFLPGGEAFGANGSACVVDLLPQAFAVFAGVGSPVQRRSALLAAFSALWSEEYKTLRLFYPPFTQKGVRAGYVNDYPPGVRENAGQYTHAAVWFYMALRQEGLHAQAQKLLPALLPQVRTADPALAARFLNEPYAPTADICMAPGLEGRGGWSLYTGAAGWLRRALEGGAF